MENTGNFLFFVIFWKWKKFVIKKTSKRRKENRTSSIFYVYKNKHKFWAIANVICGKGSVKYGIGF
jgi:hypothetical protein